jgi:hypothetical protein
VSDERIDPKVIEAAARRYDEVSAQNLDKPNAHRRAIGAAIRAADQERGLKEEFSVVHEDSRRQETNKESALALTFHPSGRRIESRYTSDWRPVERPS